MVRVDGFIAEGIGIGSSDAGAGRGLTMMEVAGVLRGWLENR